jgi:hypothetical protein
MSMREIWFEFQAPALPISVIRSFECAESKAFAKVVAQANYPANELCRQAHHHIDKFKLNQLDPSDELFEINSLGASSYLVEGLTLSAAKELQVTSRDRLVRIICISRN